MRDLNALQPLFDEIKSTVEINKNILDAQGFAVDFGA